MEFDLWAFKKTITMKNTLITFTLMLVVMQTEAQDKEIDLKFEDAVPVLNMGTFHMGYTPDATTTEFDEHDQENIREVHKIARAIAAFKPTVIVVERLPENNEKLQKVYREYLENPDMEFSEPSEVELLAFEMGRLAETERIYGIDFREGYNYRIAEQVQEGVDNETYHRYMKELGKLQKQYPEKQMTVLEKLQWANDTRYHDILINSNADMLTHISSKGKAEGADEASKFYHRNLVMYSNLNQIELSENDRVFILMGASHTAFFNMWLSRSPKYKMVEMDNFLK